MWSNSRAPAVLVVDDVEHTRRLVRMMLGRLGHFEIFDAADGSDALEILKLNAIDVVISDWDMPIISGMELWDFIRGGQCGVVEFILMCSTTNRARIDEVRKSGIKYFLKKPFSTAQLEQRLSAAIDYTAARNMAM